MNSLFITGAGGFIGRRLIKQITLDHDEKMFCLVRSKTSDSLFPSSCEPIVGDIRQPESYSSVLEECRTVLHLAAITGKANRSEYFDTNAEGTRLLIQECKRKGAQNFLFVSTIVVKYQDTK